MTDTVRPIDLPVLGKPVPASLRIVEEDEPCEHTRHPSVESVLVVRRREAIVIDFYRNRPE
jgi:hypothetical protein